MAGLRDIGLAVNTLAIYFYEPRALRTFAPGLLLIPIGDAYLAVLIFARLQFASLLLGLLESFASSVKLAYRLWRNGVLVLVCLCAWYGIGSMKL